MFTTTLALGVVACGPSPSPSLVARGPANGFGADAATAPTRHVVRPGDTLAALAARYGVTVGALAAANGLAPPYALRAAEELRLPPGAVDRAREYTVRPGDTLFEIATRFGTTVRALADASDVSDPDYVVAGQVLVVLPDELVPRRPRPSARGGGGGGAARRVSTGPALLPPVQGEVAAGFADAGGGIEFVADAGAPVRAVADGVVVYAGPGLADGAGVVLLRHEDGGIAVYARTAELLVAQGDRVRRGAVIARLPEAERRPRLRFELRENGHQVDPSARLSAAAGLPPEAVGTSAAAAEPPPEPSGGTDGGDRFAGAPEPPRPALFPDSNLPGVHL